MFLRWMVRHDDKGVDFGIWKVLKSKDLICPCDVHVDRVGRLLGLIYRKQTDWLTAIELTENLKQFDPNDTVSTILPFLFRRRKNSINGIFVSRNQKKLHYLNLSSYNYTVIFSK